MWKPNIERKQGLIGRWLERRKRKSGDMDHTQFHFKQIHHITKSQEPLKPEERTKTYIPRDAKTAYPGEKAIEIRFCSTQIRAEAKVYIYAARKDDDIVKVASGLIGTGSQDTKRNGQRCYYIEKIIIDDNWLSPIRIARSGVGRIMVRTHGYHRFFTKLKFESGEWFVDMVGCELW